MRRHFPSRLAESFFLRQACAFVLAVLLAPSAVRADQWSGIGSDWFATTSWSFGNNGPPSTSESAFFDNSSSGVPLAVTNVQLSASTTIQSLSVDSPLTKQYTFTGANGAVLTATSQMQFQNSDFQALNVHTIESLRLNTPDVNVFDNAILSLNNSTVTTNSIGIVNNGRIDVNSGSSVQTLTYILDQPTGELRVNSGGELRIAGDTTLLRGTTTINSGGQLNALSGVDLEYNGTAVLQFADSHAVDAGVHLKATGGGDITAVSFIDVGNGVVGSLTVTGAGSTLTSAGSISDWGAGSAGNATVTIADSGFATASQLRAGTGSAVFQGNVTSGGTLRTTSTFRMGGGSTIRTVALNVDGGTLETNGLATFDDRADLNLVSGTVAFNGGATLNAGSRIDWTGGTLSLGTNRTLLVDGGVFNKTSSTDFTLSDNTTTRIRNGGSLTSSSFFDLGNATLDMTGGTLNVGTAGGAVSDWGGNGATTTATLAGGAVATYTPGLRMGALGDGGTTSATISGGARLVSTDTLITGGEAASNVMLNVAGGRVDSDGAISLLRGTTTIISAAGVMEGQNITLGSTGGATLTTVTGANSLLKARGKLVAGRVGTSGMAISAGGEVETLGAAIIGELAGADATVVVEGTGSRLDVGTSLTVGGAGTGRLEIHAGGFVPVTAGIIVGNMGTLDLTGGALEVSPGQSVTSTGLIRVSGAGQIRANIVNDGTLNIGLGGSVVSVNTFAGVNQTGAAVITVDGANSILRATGNLELGRASSLTTTAAGTIHVGDNTAGSFPSDRLVVGDNNPVVANLGGKIYIAGGSVLNHHSSALIAPNTNSFGSAVVTGANSRFAIGGELSLGASGGSGELQVRAGGRVTSVDASAGGNSAGSGAISIDGADSVLTAANNFTLNRASTVAITGGGSLAVGDGAGAFGNGITIADSNSIDANAGGLLTIAGGSTVTTPGLVFLSRNAAHSGRVVVTGAGSTLTADTVFVSERGRGHARIEAGGKINATGQFQVGSEVEGHGTAAITGAGSTLTADFLTVGLFSEGELEIENGGRAVASVTNVGQFAGSAGAIVVRGANSRLEVANTLTVGNLGAGTLNVDSGGVATAANVTVNSASTLNLSGSSVVQSSIDNRGLLSVFDSSVTGGVTLRADSTMSFDNSTIGSLTHQAGADIGVSLQSASTFDNLAVTGAASLGGNIAVSLLPGFAPAPGVQFPILTAGSITGTPNFDFSAAPLASGLIWAVALAPTSLTLQVISTGIAGDFNGNGLVDGADFLLWQRGGSPNPLSPGDLALWKSNFGASGMATPTTSAIPEPQALLLAALACLVLRRRCR